MWFLLLEVGLLDFLTAYSVLCCLRCTLLFPGQQFVVSVLAKAPDVCYAPNLLQILSVGNDLLKSGVELVHHDNSVAVANAVCMPSYAWGCCNMFAVCESLQSAPASKPVVRA